MVGCDCAVCASDDPRDWRNRTSGLIEIDGTAILIDTGPELRIQCLRHNVRRVDAVLITHSHADHILGLDDIRSFNQRQRCVMPIYARSGDVAALDKIFGYARFDRHGGDWNLPQLDFIACDGPFDIAGIPIVPLELPHGAETVCGYRIGDVAWCTDLSGMSETVIEQLGGLKVLVLGALRPKEHPKHLNIDQAIDLAQRIGAGQTWFVHMSHHASHQQLLDMVPAGIAPAYDGLTVTVQ